MRVAAEGKLPTTSAKLFDTLYPNFPIAVIEVEDLEHALGDGMQQGLDYGESLDAPFVFSTNGKVFLLHDRTGTGDKLETELDLDNFPSPDELRARFQAWKVSIDEIRARNFNLDIKNPRRPDAVNYEPYELLTSYSELQARIQTTRDQLKTALASGVDSH